MEALIGRFEEVVRYNLSLELEIAKLRERDAKQVSELLELYKKLKLWELVRKGMYYNPQQRLWCLQDSVLESITDPGVRDVAKLLFAHP